MRAATWWMLLALGTAPAACGDDLGQAADAAPPGSESPFGAPERTWTWVPVAGNQCMDGSATGMGVNLDLGTDKLMVFLEGGGACFNGLSCLTAAHPDGFGPADLDALVAGQDGLLDRTDPQNPVRGWSWVVIPYCTGDQHAGGTVNGFGGRIQDGYDNVGRALRLVAGALGGRLGQVLVAGQGAGGFGALYNYDQVARAFGDVPVALADDSGPVLGDQVFTPCLQTLWRDLWDLNGTFPEDCADCVDDQGGGLANLWPFLADKYPDARFGLVQSVADLDARRIYGFGYPDCGDPAVPMETGVFQAGLLDLIDQTLAPLPGSRAFVVDGTEGVFTDQPLAATAVGGTTLAGWLRGLIEGAAGWDTVEPAP